MLNQIDLNLLPVLDSLSKTESVKATAAEFSVTSSAISQSMMRLEDQLGVQLLLREHKQIRLSPKGLELIRSVRDSIQSTLNILNEVKREAASNELSGIISVGCPSEFGTSFLISWFSELQRQYPKLQIELRLGSPKTLLGFLLDGDVDFIIADDGPYYDQLGQGFSQQRIFEEELILCGSAKFMEEIQAKKSFETLSNLPHLDYSSDGSAVGIWYKFYFKKAPNKLNLSLVSENVRALISGVRHHLGVAMIPKYLIRKDIEKGTVIEISPDKRKFVNAYVLVQHQNKVPSKAEKVFMQMLKSKNRVVG